MSKRFHLRTGLLCAGAVLIGGCASTTEIDSAELPPEATVDDGIDYYSAELGAEELLGYGDDQWTTDEEGNRVYLLNRVRRGKTVSYYVGDIRYLYANDNSEGLRGTGYGNTPVYVSRGGAPLQSPTYRGGRDDTYYQTRRGRITYLPNGNRPATNSTPSNTPASSGPSSSNPPPRPTAAPPRPPRPVATPRPQSPPRTRPAEDSRRPDR